LRDIEFSFTFWSETKGDHLPISHTYTRLFAEVLL